MYVYIYMDIYICKQRSCFDHMFVPGRQGERRRQANPRQRHRRRGDVEVAALLFPDLFCLGAGVRVPTAVRMDLKFIAIQACDFSDQKYCA